MQEIMPFLMRFLTEQMMPGSKLAMPPNILQDSIEAVSVERDEKMDWSESIPEIKNNAVAMAMEDGQSSEKWEVLRAPEVNEEAV